MDTAHHFIATHSSRVNAKGYTYGATWIRHHTTVTWQAMVRLDGQVVTELNGTCSAIATDGAALHAVKAFVAAAIDQFAARRR